jgi:transketolase
VFGDELVDHRTWVIAGDGCLMEGINHEAVGLAGHLKLGRLNVLWDDNRITIDGAVDLSSSEDVIRRYDASGWHTIACDGHDPADVGHALATAAADPRPSLIACRTIIGFGSPNKQGTSATHGAALGVDEVKAAREVLKWESPDFELPDAIVSAWRAIGQRGSADRAAWEQRLVSSSNRDEFERRMAGRLPVGFSLDAYQADLLANPQKVATRRASELTLGAINDLLPETIGGSADLTGSNNTKTKSQKPLTANDYSGRYIYYGIREFGMGCAMNGMALHGGVIPYGGTFLVFSDYCRPAIRLSALQQTRAIYVMTHDSIGLGEDGPTHQPVEHVMSLRLIPNLDVYRPADTIETAECWALALAKQNGPSLLALSRQNLPQVRDSAAENMSARGAYRLRSATGTRKVVLIASGSEVEIALGVADLLEAEGIGADVVSMPCWSRFDAQPQDYKDDVLPDVQPSEILRVSIEAGTTIGWERYTMARGLRFGIDGFGASAPAPDLYTHFGLTPGIIAPQILAALGK